MTSLPDLKNPFVNARVIGAGVDQETYRRQEPGVDRGNPALIMGSGEIRDFNFCPHRWRMGWTLEESKATEDGQLIDTLLLSPDKADERIAVCPEFYEKRVMRCPNCGSETDSAKCAKCKCDREPVTIKKPWQFGATVTDEWKKEREGKLIVKHEDFQLAENAVKFIHGHPEAGPLVQCSKTQVMVVGEYHDPETGLVIPVRALIDLLPDKADETFGKALADLKRTGNACEGAWTKKVWEMRYDIQAAFYLDLYTAATGEDRCEFRHLVQESQPPWETVVWPLSTDFVDLGRRDYQAALRRYCQCLATNTWPGYQSTLGYIGPRPYMLEG